MMIGSDSSVRQYPASVPNAIGEAPVKLMHVTVEWSCACGMRNILCYNPQKAPRPDVACTRCGSKYTIETTSEVQPR